MEENIRQDTESKLHFKYVYIRRAVGYFYQMGVLAENINSFMAKFESRPFWTRFIKNMNPYLVPLLNRGRDRPSFQRGFLYRKEVWRSFTSD